MKKFRIIQHHNEEKLNEFKIIGDIVKDKNFLKIRYYIIGKLENISISKFKKDQERKFCLWEDTCFELFIKSKKQNGYWEFNFSPSTDWNAFRFIEYRKDIKEEMQIDEIKVFRKLSESNLQVDVIIDLAKIKQLDEKLELAISAIVKDKDDKIYHFALIHNKDEPDFHDPNSFNFIL